MNLRELKTGYNNINYLVLTNINSNSTISTVTSSNIRDDISKVKMYYKKYNNLSNSMSAWYYSIENVLPKMLKNYKRNFNQTMLYVIEIISLYNDIYDTLNKTYHEIVNLDNTDITDRMKKSMILLKCNEDKRKIMLNINKYMKKVKYFLRVANNYFIEVIN